MKKLGPFSVSTLPGDLMALAAGALWASTTVYIKKYLSHRTVPLQTLFYQCIVVAFLSYLVWFELIHRYPVSLLHAFSFFTPVFGVFLSGALILGEIMSPSLVVALALVSTGMVLVNRGIPSKSHLLRKGKSP
jgi:drug/metabolite transporter (DMT)-like permease